MAVRIQELDSALTEVPQEISHGCIPLGRTVKLYNAVVIEVLEGLRAACSHIYLFICLFLSSRLLPSAMRHETGGAGRDYPMGLPYSFAPFLLPTKSST